MTTSALDRPLAAAADSPALQPAAGLIGRVGEVLTKDDRMAALLHGRWLGHPLHAAAVQLPLGFLLSATLADRLKGGERAARALLGMTVLSAVPASAAGLADAGKANVEQQRVAALHAGLNVLALGLTGVGWVRHRRGKGQLATLAASGVMGTSAFVGGHLSYRMATGANHAAGLVDRLPDGWTDLGPLADLPEAQPVRRQVGDVLVVVVRYGGEVSCLVEECSHLSGPLSEGEVVDGCVVCPWHGSTFDLLSGQVRGGPAVSPQPVLAATVLDGRVHVRRRTEG